MSNGINRNEKYNDSVPLHGSFIENSEAGNSLPSITSLISHTNTVSHLLNENCKETGINWADSYHRIQHEVSSLDVHYYSKPSTDHASKTIYSVSGQGDKATHFNKEYDPPSCDTDRFQSSFSNAETYSENVSRATSGMVSKEQQAEFANKSNLFNNLQHDTFPSAYTTYPVPRCSNRSVFKPHTVVSKDHALTEEHNDVPCYYSPACQETLGDYKEVDIPICTWQQTTKKEEEASTIEKK